MWFSDKESERKKEKVCTQKNIKKWRGDNVKNDFISNVKKYGESSQKDTFVEGYWSLVKGALLEVTDRSCG